MLTARSRALALVCGALAFAPAAAAQASTLDLSIPGTLVVGESITGTVSGTADVTSYVDVYVQEGADACAPSSRAERQRPESRWIGIDGLVLGPYSFTSSPITGLAAGPVRICVYLYDNAVDDDQPPGLARDALVTIVERDSDGDGISDRADRCGTVPAPTPDGCPPPPPPPPPPPVPSIGATSRDTAGPAVGLAVAKQTLAAALGRGVKVRIDLSEAGSACVQLALTLPQARRMGLAVTRAQRRSGKIVAGRRCVFFDRRAQQTIAVRLTSKVARAARRLVRTRRSLRLAARVEAQDAAGNTVSRARVIVLGR